MPYAYPWIQLQKSFLGFFRKKARHPKFRAKHRSPESFYVCHREMDFDGKVLHVWPDKLKLGPIRMREELRFKGRVMGATVRRDGDRWMLSVQVDVGDGYRKKRTADGTVGVDLGITTLATLSRLDFTSDPDGSDVIPSVDRREDRGAETAEEVVEEAATLL